MNDITTAQSSGALRIDHLSKLFGVIAALAVVTLVNTLAIATFAVHNTRPPEVRSCSNICR